MKQLFEGNGMLQLLLLPSKVTYDFSTRFEADGIKFEEPNDNMFSFNSPLGACPTCEGLDTLLGLMSVWLFQIVRFLFTMVVYNVGTVKNESVAR